jgi:general stress protein 26
MGNTQHLSGSEANDKIKELAEKVHVCLFTTNLGSQPLSARPMSCAKVEDDGALWFFSQKSSEHNGHIEKDNHVQLFFSNTNSSEYMSVYGNAEITEDRKKVEEMWNPILKNWFNEGKDDPEISLIKVTPESGYYWDTKSNKVVQLLKMAAGAVIGKPLDDGLEGKISP